MRIAEQAGLGAQMKGQGIPLRAADSGQDHRVGRVGAGDRGIRQWNALGLVGTAADQGFLGLEGDAATILQPSEKPAGLLDDFGADTVAGEQEDLMGHQNSLLSK